MSLLLSKIRGILEDDDLTYLINYTIQPTKNSNGSNKFTMQFKTVDPPIIKTFNEIIEVGSLNTTITRTIEWDIFYTGDGQSTNIRASATNMLLVLCDGKVSGGGTNTDLYASNGIDTADGTKILDNWNPLTSPQPPPIPIILDVNQYLTLSKTNGPSFTRTFAIKGVTVELPADFALS